MIKFSGPIFETDCDLMKLVNKDNGVGAHYSVWSVNRGKEMQTLKLFFPDGEANSMNFVLFSTSGIHGSYLTIEKIEKSLIKYSDKIFEPFQEPEDYHRPFLTGLIIQPRLVCMRYFGEMKITLEDIAYLKKLRASSIAVVTKIGFEE